MRRSPSILLLALTASVAAVAAPVLGAAPPAAAKSDKPKISVESRFAVVESEFAAITVEYRCAPGSTASLSVSARQGGTASEPVSLYDTSSPFATVPALDCDGEKRTAEVGLILVGFDESTGSAAFEPFTPTALGGDRVRVTATLTDQTTGRSDTSDRRVRVLAR